MPMSPEEFLRQMQEIAQHDNDAECRHRAGDSLMMELLKSLGYGAGVNVFDDMTKWYS